MQGAGKRSAGASGEPVERCTWFQVQCWDADNDKARDAVSNHHAQAARVAYCGRVVLPVTWREQEPWPKPRGHRCRYCHRARKGRADGRVNGCTMHDALPGTHQRTRPMNVKEAEARASQGA